MMINQHHIIVSQNNPIPCDFQCNPSRNRFGICTHPCYTSCPNVCKALQIDPFQPFLPPPPPPLKLPTLDNDKNQTDIPMGSITIMVCLVGASLLMTILCVLLRIQYTRQRNSRGARMAPIIFGTQEDFDFDRGPGQIDHPLWYINTIGLEQSLIESITMFKYRKDEGLINGTECSVCLGEFEEDESVRLLPKCDHAFHVNCIDTWLRSHKNCPLCRAPIVCSNFDSRVGVLDPPVLNSSSNEDSAGSSRSTTEVRNEEGVLIAEHLGIRVESDLVANGQREDVEVEMQPKIKRSASLDSHLSLALSGRHRRGSSEIGLKLKNVVKRGSKRSLSFNKMMMTRSGVLISSVWVKRRSGSLGSILPL